jgi:hypothetical protein
VIAVRSLRRIAASAAALACAAWILPAEALVCGGGRATSYYGVDNGTGVVSYSSFSDPRLGVRQRRLAGADASTFRRLSRGKCFAGYAVDAKSVYYEGAKVPEADAGSFQAIDDDYAPHLSWYAKDRNRWYGEGKPLAMRTGELRIVNPGYAVHPDGAFFGGRKLEADGFEVLGLGGYARSRSQVYFRGEALAGIDARTFRLYPENDVYGRDKDHVVVKGKVQPQIDAASFTLVTGGVGKDRKHLYWGLEQVAGVDPARVVWLGRGYWKDDKSVFFSNGRIQGADAPSFRLLLSHAIDKGRVYHHEKALDGIDAASFQEIGFGYARDRGGVYHYGRALPGADGESFSVKIDGRGWDKGYGYRYDKRVCAWAAAQAPDLPACKPADFGRQ